MARLKLTQAVQVRTDRRIRDAFKRRIAELQEHGTCSCAGAGPTMEAVTSALWLWLAGLPLADADAFLDEIFPALAQAVRDTASPLGKPVLIREAKPEDPPAVARPDRRPA
jgi:hypothetical protein